MEKISKHIAYSEGIRSELAKRLNISNEPDEEQLIRMKLVAEKVFEFVRGHFNVPIYISSFFRSSALNEALGGANDSQHMANNGAAIDLDCDVYGKITNKELFDYIKDNLVFDQVIAESISEDGTGGWVHCSYKKENNRNQVLVMTKVNGEAIYEKYV